jgi:hypothetical protein
LSTELSILLLMKKCKAMKKKMRIRRGFHILSLFNIYLPQHKFMKLYCVYVIENSADEWYPFAPRQRLSVPSANNTGRNQLSSNKLCCQHQPLYIA